MDENVPHLERRLLPLLDVTLVLVGMLMLLVGVANLPPVEAPPVVHLEALRTGDIIYDDVLLAEALGGINAIEYETFLVLLQAMDPVPVILITFPDPDPAIPSDLEALVVVELRQRLTASGFEVVLTTQPPGGDQ